MVSLTKSHSVTFFVQIVFGVIPDLKKKRRKIIMDFSFKDFAVKKCRDMASLLEGTL